MKVAIVTPMLSHFEVPLFRLAAALPGLDVRVFHNEASDDAFYDKDYGTVIDWGERLTVGYPNTYFPTVAALQTELFAWRPSVILQSGYAWKGALSVLAQSRRRGIPIVHRGLTSIYRDPRVTRHAGLRRKLRDIVLKRFCAHHYGGTYSRQVLERIGFPANRCYFVPFSVDTPYFDKLGASESARLESLALRERLGWAAESPVILFLANQTWVKGPDIFVEAAALAQRERPDLNVLAVGSGQMTDGLKARAAEVLAPGSYHFPGFVTSKSTVPHYLVADLVVFPSRYDTWARAVNEAMVCRRPCMTSRWVAAAGGLVEDGHNGCVVDSLNAADYAQRIVAFLAIPPKQRLRMGEAARARALEFSYEAHTDNLYRSLTEVVG